MKNDLIKYKKIIEIIESGNIHDERYKLLIQSMSVDQLMTIRKFVQLQEYANEVNEVIKKRLNWLKMKYEKN